MNPFASSSRQPLREPWTLARLRHERAIALGLVLEPGSKASYTSALHSYLTFCNMHNLSVNPTPDTLSFFVIYMSHHIKLRSVEAYLSGICNQLEPFFPDVRNNRRQPLVTRTLAGCKKRFTSPIAHKRPLSRADLVTVATAYVDSSIYDDKLFVAMLLVGFFGLLRLGRVSLARPGCFARLSQTHPPSVCRNLLFRFRIPITSS